jgi:hypothetical protein
LTFGREIFPARLAAQEAYAMPAESTQFKNKALPYVPIFVNGLPVYNEGSKSAYLGSAGYFAAGTGNSASNPYFGIADVTPGQSSNVVLIPDFAVPLGMRCYLTSVGIDVQGYVSWSCSSPTAGAVPYLAIQDSAGVPAVVCPFNSLRGHSELYFPAPDVSVPLVLGPNTVNGPVGTPVTTFSYAAGVITAGAAVFSATYSVGVGSPCRVIDGTGKGQAGFITAVGSTTTATVTPAFSGLDSTSVIAIDFQALSAYGSTTSVTIQNGGGTPFTSNAFDNGFNVIGISGASAGSVRPISASTTAGQLTLPYALNTAMNTTTTAVYVTNNSELNGAVDCCVADKWATLTASKGIVAAVNLQSGTSPVGSAVRVYCEGFFAV